jgi:non-canonical poly(A) RNA polymerase PAPD5/7
MDSTPSAPADGASPAPSAGIRALLSSIKQTKKTPDRQVSLDTEFISLDFGSESKNKSTSADKRKREDDVATPDSSVVIHNLDFISFNDIEKSSSSKAGGEPKSAESHDKKKQKVETPNAAENDSEVYNKKSPWSKGRKYQHSGRDRTVSLHHEICDFVEFIQPVRAEVKKRDELVAHLRAITEQLWPEARLEVFGSCVTGLQLPCSDVDMVVLDYTGNNPLEKFASVIKADGGYTKIQVIAKAKVPIIKFEDLKSGTPLNVCFGQEDGVHNSQLVKELVDYYPALRPLVLVMKQFLYNRDLHETYTGGVGSYLLVMTVVSMLQNHPGRGPVHKEGESNFGALLLDYLQLYGTRFNYEDIGR